MDIRIIKTEQQYRRYLEEVDRLVALDPDPRTAEGARLELLAKWSRTTKRSISSSASQTQSKPSGSGRKLGIPSELLIQEPRAEYRVERKPRKTKRVLTGES
jgi:hypothetical protein